MGTKTGLVKHDTRISFYSAGVAWFVAGGALLRGSLYNEVPPLWVGVVFVNVSVVLFGYGAWVRWKK